jgi:hypothetical protein
MMNQEKSVLPADFDGVFRFTNFTNTDFSARWAGIEYTFPALKTTPMIIPGSTPEEVQNIRKKFAKELAEREFYKSEKLRALEAQTPVGSAGSFRMAAIYTESDLKPFIQKCLEPLPMAQAAMKVMPKADESAFRKDGEGNLVTQVLDKSKSLTGNGSGVIA